MSDWDDLHREPYRFDLFRVLRELERVADAKPRIGDSKVVAQAVVGFAQDLFLEFPAANINEVDATSQGVPRLHTRFLSFFGPQGALPLSTTVEALGWFSRDKSFPRFVDVFANRFLQLFFRAWADARPITQHDRPHEDRFAAYVGSFAGIGTAAYSHRDSVPDLAKLAFSGLAGSRIKSARRLAQLLRGVLGLDVHVTERMGSWLVFEPSDQMALGTRGASLGVDSFLGARAYSINDKFRVHIRTASLAQYTSLLPDGKLAGQVADLVFFYLGHRFEYDVELSLPAHLAPPARLGQSGQLGYTAWMAPPERAPGQYVSDARFNLVERRRAAATRG